VAVARAALELHVRETGGQNRGPLVEAIQLYAAGARYFPWCVAFCDVCLRLGFAAVGQEPPLSLGLSCSKLVRGVDILGRVYELAETSTGRYPLRQAQPGDLLVLRGGETGFRHMGLVVEPQQADGTVPTIEGNTNDAGSAEGDGVYMKHRNPRRSPAVFVSMHLAAPQRYGDATPGDPGYRGIGAGLAQLVK
jgi:hypothetical protein